MENKHEIDELISVRHGLLSMLNVWRDDIRETERQAISRGAAPKVTADQRKREEDACTALEGFDILHPEVLTEIKTRKEIFAKKICGIKKEIKMPWTKKSYDALHLWVVSKSGRVIARQALLTDGLTDVVSQLDSAHNMGVWYKITREAAKAVGPQIVAISAKKAESELSIMAAKLGQKGGTRTSERKKKSSRQNGARGGRQKKLIS